MVRFILGICTVGMLCLLHSCKKDKGNYKYKQVNEAVVTGLDSLYVVSVGQALKIAPAIKYSLDPSAETDNYVYQWLLINKDPLPSGIPKVLDSGPVFRLSSPSDLTPGAYNLTFRITDKRTNLWKEYPFQLILRDKNYEGWLLLNETTGQGSRLDMLSYDLLKGGYDYIFDVLKAMNSDFTLSGSPDFVAFGIVQTNYSVDENRLVISASNSSAFLDIDSFKNKKRNSANLTFRDGTTKKQNAETQLDFAYRSLYLNVDGNVYSTNFQYVALLSTNIYRPTGQPFKASLQMAANRDGCVLFDLTNSRFLWAPKDQNSCDPINLPELNDVNKDLLYMCSTQYNGGETFAILKDKDGKIYLLRFTLTQVNYYQEITNTSIAQAEHFAVSDDFGYIFYTVGGILYEYDFSLNLTIPMESYSGKSISLIKFQDLTENFPLNSSIDPRYKAIAKQLIVCSFDRANPYTSGQMDLYDVPPINGPLNKASSFTGLGKVVSVTYRNR